jgi:hypothetical protein
VILKSALVQKFRSIEDSGTVHFEPDVTCLVGRNESGKTAFLEALFQANPVAGGTRGFNELRDYPRRLRGRDRAVIAETAPITASFELSDADLELVGERFGPDVLTSRELKVERTYADRQRLVLHHDQHRHARNVLVRAGLDPRMADGCGSLEELLRRLEAEPAGARPAEVAELLDELRGRDPVAELGSLLASRLPLFLYFDGYSVMPGRVSIPRLQKTAVEQLLPGERTALSLLRLAGVAADEFVESEYEARKAALESAANSITEEVFRYWSQNPELAVELDVDFRSGAGAPGPPPFLDVRIRNDRHRVTMNFGERSGGFVWFFSFLAAFSELREAEDVVLLLDEPGLGLHATGQADLLRYVDEQLAPGHQVVYTTHSPFMVDPTRLDRARTVEDVEGEGTRVREGVEVASRGTVLPLHGALAFQLLGGIGAGPRTLLVDGPADVLYLEIMSAYLRDGGRHGLSQDWTPLPVGGLAGIPAAAALLGAPLPGAVLLGVGVGHPGVLRLVHDGMVLPERLVALTELTGQSEAGVEDLFDDLFYLHLLAAAGIELPHPNDLAGSGSVVGRLERALGSPIDRYGAARFLLCNQQRLLPGIGREPLQRFARLFAILAEL